MNYVYLLIEVVLVYLLMILFYKKGKKEGLYIYSGILSSILSVIIYKSIDLLSFQVNLGIPLIMGMFICNNIIIQKYGLDEIKKIIGTVLLCFIFPYSLLFICNLIPFSEYNAISNDSFNNLFGYNFNTLRIFLASILSMSSMLWLNGSLYYFIRKSQNSIILSNIGSIFVIQFIGSIIFIFVSYIGLYEIIEIFGMLVIRYLFKIVIGIIGLVPIYIILKVKDR